jgi:hypothetical protein
VSCPQSASVENVIKLAGNSALARFRVAPHGDIILKKIALITIMCINFRLIEVGLHVALLHLNNTPDKQLINLLFAD